MEQHKKHRNAFEIQLNLQTIKTSYSEDGGFGFLWRAWASFEKTDKFVNVIKVTLFK